MMLCFCLRWSISWFFVILKASIDWSWLLTNEPTWQLCITRLLSFSQCTHTSRWRPSTFHSTTLWALPFVSCYPSTSAQASHLHRRQHHCSRLQFMSLHQHSIVEFGIALEKNKFSWLTIQFLAQLFKHYYCDCVTRWTYLLTT